MRAKLAILILFLTYSNLFSQISLLDVTKSVIYVSYKQDTPTSAIYNYIFLKKVLYDTTINGKSFSKIEWAKFKNNELDKITFNEYERLVDNEYILLDSSFQTIHNVKLIADSENPGIIFGKKGQIKAEYIDSREYSPEEKLIPSIRTPLKFYMDDDCERNIIYRKHLNTIERTQDCNEGFKYLIDDIFTELSEGLNNTIPIESDFDLNAGDEIQLVYKKKSYNDSTFEAAFVNTQIISIIYGGETIINNNKNLIITIDGINLSTGTDNPPQTAYLPVNDSGFYMEKYFIPTKDFKPMLKIDSLVADNETKAFISLSAYTYDTLNGKPFPYYTNYRSDSYLTSHIVTYFPMIYFSGNDTEGEITYAKLKGMEYGTKIIPGEKNDETHIRNVTCLSKNKVKVEVFSTEPGIMQIQLQTEDAKDIFKEKFGVSKTGLTEFILDTPDLENNEIYQVQIQIQKGNHVTAKMLQFKAKY